MGLNDNFTQVRSHSFDGAFTYNELSLLNGVTVWETKMVLLLVEKVIWSMQ